MKTMDETACGRAASYARYSSDLQSEDSVESQQRRCRERAEREGLHIPGNLQFSDSAVSGTKRNRAGLDAMLKAAASGQFSVLYIYSLSRLARELSIALPLLKEIVHVHGVRVVSISEGVDSVQPGWDTLSTILSLQHERFVVDLAQNVFRGQEQTVFAGFSVGDYCFGYRSEPITGTEQARRGRGAKPRMRYVVDPETSDLVRKIFHWFVVEQRPIRWITRELNRLGAPKDHRSTTKEWHHQYIPKLLANEKYVGIWPWGRNKNVRNPLTGQVSQVDRPAADVEKFVRRFPELQIIDDATFAKAQDLLRENRERVRRNRRADGTLRQRRGEPSPAGPRHLLSALVRCGQCGSRFQVGGKNGRYLKCQGHLKGTCTCRTQLSRPLAEQQILDAIGQRILAEPALRTTLLDLVRAAWMAEEQSVPSELAAAERQLAEVERRISRLLDQVEDGAADPNLNERLAQRRAEKEVSARTVERLRRRDENRRPAPTPEWIAAELGRLGAELNGATPAAALALRELVGGEIVVQEVDRERGSRKFLRGTLRITRHALARAVAGVDLVASEAVDATTQVDEVVVDFVRPALVDEQVREAMQLYEEEELGTVAIAERMGCVRSYVSKLLQLGFAARGEAKPDLRSCRRRADPTPPKFEAIAEDAKRLEDEGRLLQEIADELQCDRATATKALDHWYSSRDLKRPDGRTRRKGLVHKTSTHRTDLPLQENQEPPSSTAP